MKLLTIRNYPEKYGAEGHVLRVAVGLARQDWDVHAAFPRSDGMQAMIETCRKNNVHHHEFGDAGSTSQSVIASRMNVLRSTLRLVREINPDVVQVTLGWPNEAVPYAVASALLNVPLLAVFQYAPEVVALKLPVLNLCHWARRRRQTWAAVSSQNLDALSKTFKSKPGEIKILYNGADTDSPLAGISASERDGIRKSVRSELGLPENTQILLTTGRLSKQKGYFELVEALPKILARHTDVRFLWAGTGEEELRLKQHVEKAGMRNYVTFLGYRSDVSRLLVASDLFIFPTLAEGGCSSSIREAMVHSLPIVSTLVGGIPEVIDNRHHGLLVRPGDPDKLVEAVHWALEHPGEMRDMAAKAKARIQDFSADRMIAEYAAVFLAIAASAHSTQSQLA